MIRGMPVPGADGYQAKFVAHMDHANIICQDHLVPGKESEEYVHGIWECGGFKHIGDEECQRRVMDAGN